MSTAAVGAFTCMLQTSQAQSFAPSLTNPFELTPTGEINIPVFADLDNDGDLDMLAGLYDGNFIYFQNIGTMTTPVFDIPQINPFGLTIISDGFLNTPTVADLDGDGDLDIVTTEYYGSFLFYKNTGTASAPAFIAPLSNPFGLISVPYLLFPTMVDLDSDGDLDILAEIYSEDFMYYKNIGTANAPAFDSPLINPYGLPASGYIINPEFADLDSDGDLDMMAGGYYGKFLYFKNIGDAVTPSFNVPHTNPFQLESTGYVNIPTFADLDDDGDADIMSADYYGNFLFFQNETMVAVSPLSVEENFDITLYPNPSNGQFTIELNQPSKIEIIDALGRLVFAKQFNAGRGDVYLDKIIPGNYTVKILSKDRQFVRQMVIHN